MLRDSLTSAQRTLAEAEARMAALLANGLTSVPLLVRAGRLRRKVEDARRAVERERQK